MFWLDEGDVAWYPRQKIQNAKKKLKGFNPAYVMRFVLYFDILASSLGREMTKAINDIHARVWI